MAIAFPIGIGIALVLGVFTNYINQPEGDPLILFIGVLLVTIAIIIDGIAYKKILQNSNQNPLKGIFKPDISEKDELRASRVAMAASIAVAGYFGFNPPDFAAGTVALAFGLAAASIFPAIILGIFFRRVNKEGAISGMLVGISVMLFYMMKFKLGWLGDIPPKSEWWFGISPEGFGSVAMLCNFVTSITVSMIFKKPPKHVAELIDSIRYPK